MKLGKALKKHGYLRLSKKSGYVYAVKELTWEEVDNQNREKNHHPNRPNHQSKQAYRSEFLKGAFCTSLL